MQIITDGGEAQAFLENMRLALSDMGNWKDWYILDITSAPPLDWIKQAKVTTVLRASLPEMDGSVVWLDESILLIFQKNDAFSLDEFMAEFPKTTDLKDIKLNLLSLKIDESSALIMELLTRRNRKSSNAPPPEKPSFGFLKKLLPNIDVLLGEWHKKENTREGRDKPHLMIVDDDVFTLKLVSQTLEKEYRVITAKNGVEALTKHIQLKPDIIFLDIGLPDCDGIKLLSYMQQYDKECRVVMFSADAYLKTRMKAYAGGAQGFLMKPFNMLSFQEHIGAWFKQKLGAEKK